jgi:hypothetical protein
MPIIELTLLVMGALAAFGGTIALITVAILTIGFLIDWFRDRAAQVTTDPGKVAVTVADAIDSGDVSYVQGIFDTDKRKFTEARRIKAGQVDSDVQRAHSRHQVAIWE